MKKNELESWFSRISNLLSVSFRSTGELFGVLQGFTPGEASLMLRTLQWIGIFDVEVEAGDEYMLQGRYRVTPLPIHTFLTRRIGVVEEACLPCLAIALSYILPTPLRTVLNLSLESSSIEDLSSRLSSVPRVAERLIGLSYIKSPSKSSDLYLLLLVGVSYGIIRPVTTGSGQGFVVLKKKCIGKWRSHPCRPCGLCSGRDYILVENAVQGCSKKASLPIAKNNFLLDLKRRLPPLSYHYERYYDLAFSSLTAESLF